MPRYRLDIEYDGRSFLGWQRQSVGISIQTVLEESLKKMFCQDITMQVAGRTDAGVHATGQVAHFDADKVIRGYNIAEGLNFYNLPYPICVLKATQVNNDFHARFGAVKRQYRYKILQRYAPPSFLNGLIWHIKKPLCVDSMRQAAAHLLGKHDFTTFRATQCQSKSPIRRIDRIEISEIDGQCGKEIHIVVTAKSFLHHQIRSIVGSLRQVGIGKQPISWMKDILEARDRVACGPVAPPDGLYFERVWYEGEVLTEDEGIH